ncbi:MAG TPA: diaminopimelate decarboxylase [Alphaproteobacteria bacterium]|nr:diaminopimelate decarboxylase [Alphaproteobacteria bacterium]
MSEFAYRRGALNAEDVPLARIAAEVKTPFYCYSTAALERRLSTFTAAFADVDAMVCYALKANSTLAVVRTFANLGAGADVVSEGELRVALAAGIPPERILFSGVGKTRAELEFALAAGILQINVESEPELELLGELAKGMRRPVSAALRINPDVDARTHEKITTGMKENKFGVPLSEASRLFARGAAMANLRLQGVAVHIGSQLESLAPYRRAFARIVKLAKELRVQGHDIRRLDFGGGLGITYKNESPPTVEAYAAMVKELTKGLDAQLAFEPGRFLVGNAGVLVTRVLYVKEGAAHRFVIVDAAMNDLIRPTLYDAYHAIKPVTAPAKDAALERADVVGPVCETGDFLARARPLPPLAEGDLLAICSAGAYASVMASTYNARLPAPEVMVKGSRYAVVRARPDYEDMLRRDRIPDWLGVPATGPARGVA